jgi:hypothetical protein
MNWAAAGLATLIFASTTVAFPPGTPVGQPSRPGTGATNMHVFRDITVPITQVTSVGNVSSHGSQIDVMQIKKLENGTLAPEMVVSGARTVGIAPDRKSIILRIPENAIGALNASLNTGGIILMPHR